MNIQIMWIHSFYKKMMHYMDALQQKVKKVNNILPWAIWDWDFWIEEAQKSLLKCISRILGLGSVILRLPPVKTVSYWKKNQKTKPKLRSFTSLDKMQCQSDLDRISMHHHALKYWPTNSPFPDTMINS